LTFISIIEFVERTADKIASVTQLAWLVSFFAEQASHLLVLEFTLLAFVETGLALGRIVVETMVAEVTAICRSTVQAVVHAIGALIGHKVIELVILAICDTVPIDYI